MRRDVFLFFLKAKNEDKLKQNFAQVKGKAKFCLRLSPAKYPNPQPPLRSCECGLYRLSLQTPPALPVVSASYIGSAYRPPTSFASSECFLQAHSNQPGKTVWVLLQYVQLCLTNSAHVCSIIIFENALSFSDLERSHLSFYSSSGKRINHWKFILIIIGVSRKSMTALRKTKYYVENKFFFFLVVYLG